MNKGQAGIEYVILIGVLLFFFIPIAYYSLTEATGSVKSSQINNLVSRMGKGVDAVYALGPGSVEVIPITVPQGVQSTTVGGPNNHEITLVVSGAGSSSDVHASTKANVTGVIPKDQGTYFMRIETLSDGTVNISQRG